tara:strand:- start:590 stop:1138 length:549 start_codon:yes stop_codon:yes gene_type:complete
MRYVPTALIAFFVLLSILACESNEEKIYWTAIEEYWEYDGGINDITKEHNIAYDNLNNFANSNQEKILELEKILLLDNKLNEILNERFIILKNISTPQQCNHMTDTFYEHMEYFLYLNDYFTERSSLELDLLKAIEDGDSKLYDEAYELWNINFSKIDSLETEFNSLTEELFFYLDRKDCSI